ncbi:transporter [Trichosporon asahii var. asahii CBS 2479]|uniref:Transporter n=1 Tax=Trichosporon asahii var. asahii (strain ATCC 90039 / CBS 2479 / JCM 2466 / KCTC 7840 / NBRC 103889/ NCYC 2677 / UAMH 7654) TaxID=1186058 RepID=J6ELT7_TRIAS|nr:transporter [Trichosporon asahii var. asahii CBS 2479]EJT45264.1 transporter [Trichosporon asahii var. asahii CBS 2479]
MSFFGTRLSSAVTQLRGELSAAPQTANDTITKLVEKIQTSPQVDDRRTAVLGLKGLSRDWKADVGTAAMPSLIAVLRHDAPHDVDIAKAVLETLMQLCETQEKPAKDDVGLKHIDQLLELLTARPAHAQSYVLSAPPPGVDGVLTVLDPSASVGTGTMGGGAGEMLRNEGLLLLPALLQGNSDLQKIVAFSGAFEKTLDIIHSENGIEGGIVVQDALTVIGTLLRFNVSNQNLFRELSLIPQIPPMLHFPSPIGPDEQAPDAFALQDWPEQKMYNAGLVLGLVRMLVGGPGGGNQTAMAKDGVTRCLLELALASNAPNSLKCLALNTLTPIMLGSLANQQLMSSLKVAPLVPVHADDEHPNGGFVRLPLQSTVEALVSSVVEGDPSAGGKALRSRAAGVNMFEVSFRVLGSTNSQAYVSGNDDARIGILESMSAPGAEGGETRTAGSMILNGLLDLPSAETQFDPYRPLFSCLFLSHLIRDSEHAKKLAREISLGGDDEDDKVSLIQLVVGNFMMASRAQAEATSRAIKDGASGHEEEDWTRIMVGYLVLLCTWLWDSPKSVAEFLNESNNLQTLIGPITQSQGIDPLVQGLCAFLLGVCYEFNREPNDVTRATLHPILHSRIGPDQFVSRMARLREDPRFRAVQPDTFEEGAQPPDESAPEPETDEDVELWFDWAFVDFWKNHYYTIQRSIAIEPDAVRGSHQTDGNEDVIISLRQQLKTQTEDNLKYQARLATIKADHAKDLEKLREDQEKEELRKELEVLRHMPPPPSAPDGSAELEQLRADLTSAKAQIATNLQEAAAHAETKAQLAALRDELEEEKKALTEAKERANKAEKAEADAKAAAEAATSKPELKDEGKDKADATELEKVQNELKELKDKLEKAEAAQKKAEADAKSASEGKSKAEEEAKKAAEAQKKAEDEKKKAEEAQKAAEEAAKKADSAGGKGKKGKGGAGGGGGGNAELEAKVKKLEEELSSVKTELEDKEREHEDLLVLLDELSQKRKSDKAAMREKGMDVSEDEDDDEDDE